MTIIQKLEQEQVKRLSKGRRIDNFRPGDTVRVHVRVVEGTRSRIQVFEGVVIGRKNRGLNSTFRVRKLSFGEGVERVFPLYSPNVTQVEVLRQGRVRRAKLYYLRGRTGKSARIAEKVRNDEVVATIDEVPPIAEAPQEAVSTETPAEATPAVE